MDRRSPDATGTRGRRLALICCAIAALLLAGGLDNARAQQLRSAITPDTILVGDVFRAAIRLDLPPGISLGAPDTFPISGAIENAGRRQQSTRELPAGGTEITIVYPLTAWRTGEHALPPVTITLTGPDGIREHTATFPSAYVESVLPVDTAGIMPRPPKDVIGASRLIWPWIVAALTIALGLVALVFYQRRRRPRGPALSFDVANAGSPQDRALAALDRVHDRGLLEEGNLKEFYSGTIAALRDFLEEYDTAWGTELTSAELLERCGTALSKEAAAGLERLLVAADQVKFNRRQPAAETALADWEAARHWVKAFQLRLPMAPATAHADTSSSLPPVAGSPPGSPAPGQGADPSHDEAPPRGTTGQGREEAT